MIFSSLVYLPEVKKILGTGEMRADHLKIAINANKWWWQKFGRIDFYQLMSDLITLGYIEERQVREVIKWNDLIDRTEISVIVRYYRIIKV